MISCNEDGTLSVELLASKDYLSSCRTVYLEEILGGEGTPDTMRFPWFENARPEVDVYLDWYAQVANLPISVTSARATPVLALK